MKNSIKQFVVVALSSLGTIFTTVNAQEQSDYYYQGYTFEQKDGAKSATPYLTVVMIGGDATLPKSVQMSSGIGDFSFQGVPMDIYVQNRMEVYAGNQLIGVYLPKRWTEKPPFPNGNMNAHMEVPAHLDFYTKSTIDISIDETLTLRDFLSGIAEIEMEEDNFFARSNGGSLRVFVNNGNLPASKLKSFLDTLPVSYVKACELLLYKEPNKYFAGAINLLLNIGNAGTFPTDTQYINSLPKAQ